MSKVVDHNKIRNELIDAVIRVGANNGLSGITNQAIKEASGQNEPYIYRYFIDRDDLIAKAFFASDENFFSFVEKSSSVLLDQSIPKGRHRYVFFEELLKYSLNDISYSKFYIRYYYSAMFTEEQHEMHRMICMKHFDPFRRIFAEGIDCYFVLHQVFALFLANVMDIASNSTQDTPQNRESIINTIVMMINPYLKGEEQIT